MSPWTDDPEAPPESLELPSNVAAWHDGVDFSELAAFFKERDLMRGCSGVKEAYIRVRAEEPVEVTRAVGFRDGEEVLLVGGGDE